MQRQSDIGVPRKFIALLLATTIALPNSAFAAGNEKTSKQKKLEAAAIKAMDDSKRAVHVLNRLAFGPRPGDIEKVNSLGVDKWIEQQLAPDKIDDSATQARLAPLKTLNMSAREMITYFPPPQVLQAVKQGRFPMPKDPNLRAVYEAQMEQYEARLNGQQQNAQNEQGQMQPGMMDDAQDQSAEARDRRSKRREARMFAELEAEKIIQMKPEDRFEHILKLKPEQRRALVSAIDPADRERIVEGLSDEQKIVLRALGNPNQVIVGELTQAKLLRAIYSERQLEEVMTDFWFNHFNVFIGKGADRYLTTSYERDAIRKHALGNFGDMLLATAQHPAMLFYLDNFQSVGPNSIAGKFSGSPRAARMRQRVQQQQNAFQQNNNDSNEMVTPNTQTMLNEDTPAPNPKRGLNENYARELMELHTLGVDGGYTQKDIVEVAKVFSGWTVRNPRLGGEYEFNRRIHEPGDKLVLGQKIKENGEDEGKQVLKMLVRHPSTAKFISRKLAMRFVSDNPPAALVDRMAQTFQQTEGDIKEVLRTLFKSPEFWSDSAYRAKVKTPLEFVVSAVRASGAEVKNTASLIQTLQRLGMPLYAMQPPTGYSMKADAWVNSAALLNRMNFALALGNGRLPAIQLDPNVPLRGERPATNDAAFTSLSKVLVAGDISKETRAILAKQLASEQQQSSNAAMGSASQVPNLGLISGLILGSPEFQRR